LVQTEETHVHSTCLLWSRQRRRTYKVRVSFGRDRERRGFTTGVSFCQDRRRALTRRVSFRPTEEKHTEETRLLSSRQRRHALTRRVSFRQDRGDVSLSASSMLSSYKRLGFSGRYQRSMWAQRNRHFR
jgi:hypothetical protein